MQNEPEAGFHNLLAFDRRRLFWFLYFLWQFSVALRGFIYAKDWILNYSSGEFG